MGKHSKNSAGFNDALTYHERKALGHGTAQERLGKVCDSVGIVVVALIKQQ